MSHNNEDEINRQYHQQQQFFGSNKSGNNQQRLRGGASGSNRGPGQQSGQREVLRPKPRTSNSSKVSIVAFPTFLFLLSVSLTLLRWIIMS